MGKCKELFHPRNFLLSYQQPHHFVTFEWGWPTIYLIWRLCWSLYHVTWIFITGFYSWQWTTSKENEITWFIYLTHWGYFVLTITAILELAACIHVKCNRPDTTTGDCTEMSVFIKAVWVMFNVSNTSAFAISILFWGLLYSSSYYLTASDVATHALNSLYVLANLMITAVPVRLYHFVHPMVFGVIYIVFSVIYQLSGGYNGRDLPYIYSVLDWRAPETAALYSFLTVCVLIPVCHLLIFLVYLARNAIFGKCLNRSRVSDLELREKNGRDF